uniref:Uncharacterized protein n=1 Tax=Fibrocapsa japonica TaxID=94617 RepID=A0A7S2UZW4_9STRA|mmetsp:Transcript_18961/g.27363  ORF Transcript_18961/g.27363 Transcript_18961/m.27363 type:complete len:190 (+) Transcript_18961:2-571(+)
MCRIVLLVLAICCTLLFSAAVDTKSLVDHLEDVIDNFDQVVGISFEYEGEKVENGHSMLSEQVANAPTVKLTGVQSSALYTLVMVDPDHPGPMHPINREWVHWIVTDIPGGNISRGKEILSYDSPKPVFHIHRYIIIVFKQTSKDISDEIKKRPNFHVKEFAMKHRMDPVGALFFYLHSPAREDVRAEL